MTNVFAGLAVAIWIVHRRCAAPALKQQVCFSVLALLGDMVTPGRYSTRLTHYSLLRTVEDFGLLLVGNGDANALPLPEKVWR